MPIGVLSSYPFLHILSVYFWFRNGSFLGFLFSSFLTAEISEKASGVGNPVLWCVKQLSDKRS